MKKIAVLTSGGDAPGMNACIRAVVKSAISNQIEIVGILDGFQGLIDSKSIPLGYRDVNNCVHLGGTFLGTARSTEFRTKEGRLKAIAFLNELGVDGLIVIGGDGSFAGARMLSQEMNLPVIGIPGTIDNDIKGTDDTIGFDTCLNTVTQAVDKIRDTATSHHRVFFIEVMGKNSGCIALNAAIATGAEDVLIPEEITNIEQLAAQIKNQNKGIRSSIIIVAEGDDAGGANQIMEKITPFLDGYDLRCSILGHIQRGGNPSAHDRILATRMGDFAVQQLILGKSKCMVGVIGDELTTRDFDINCTAEVILDPEKRALLRRMLSF
jgi:6-phosphofructokinase 1